MAKKIPGVDIVREVIAVRRWPTMPRSLAVRVRVQAGEERVVILSNSRAHDLLAQLHHALVMQAPGGFRRKAGG